MHILRRNHFVVSLFDILNIKSIRHTSIGDVLPDNGNTPDFIVHHSIDQKTIDQEYNHKLFSFVCAATQIPSTVLDQYMVLWPRELESLVDLLFNSGVTSEDAEDAQCYSLAYSLKHLVETGMHNKYVVVYKSYNEMIYPPGMDHNNLPIAYKE